MERQCKKCKWKIVDVPLSNKQRVELYGLLSKERKMLAIKQVNEYLKVGVTKAKGIIQHYNKDFGKCVNCDYTGLVQEFC